MGTDCDVRAAVERPEEDAVDFLIAAREEAIYPERCAEACTEVLSPHRYFPAGDEAGRSLAASRQETIIKPQENHETNIRNTLETIRKPAKNNI